ncbi:hypothetical protein KFK09_018310 [Dendrobium nobile]|uniref:Uncharacterized protein n=1 Tax=Dendrobium nobile TaxID=94219 RepID=A0A8T3AWL7_DENNO|nr:hypothetical protein KFK09_018310 [Dendrobium nobile]
MGNIVWTNIKTFSLLKDRLRYIEERESWREKAGGKGLVSEAAVRFLFDTAVGRIVCLTASMEETNVDIDQNYKKMDSGTSDNLSGVPSGGDALDMKPREIITCMESKFELQVSYVKSGAVRPGSVDCRTSSRITLLAVLPAKPAVSDPSVPVHLYNRQSSICSLSPPPFHLFFARLLPLAVHFQPHPVVFSAIRQHLLSISFILLFPSLL